ncbi:hypothetical protein LOTGIDRAFT_160886 [Lottia gigantea]|uniref:Uncharacterized protein n=1 Tax=Lottia gigantea TaxID=225164 RepID=V3ZUF9_LOTGI|nr:hypothetical protein LOTGIDRAFT_160886 [Lottia gigantea]ESO95123.1 hypothetical protein LOTGIDRAFT_160886 [Lottia gigantea]
MTDNFYNLFNQKDMTAKWDGLKVTFGAPFSGNSFSSLPRSVHDAHKDGFKKISGCDNSSPFRGERYVKDGDYAVVLLFDKNGYIAGIQAGVKVNGYPFKEITPPFTKDGDRYFMTAYFTNPCMHYWYDLHTDSDCHKMFPVFLLYNGGKLNAFGWAMIADLKSPRYEHPGQSTFTAFMNEVPTCLRSAPKLSTMHIYLTNNPALDLC